MPPEHGTDPGPLRRALDAQLRYYAGVGQVTIEYLEAVGSLARGLQLPLRLGDRSVSARPGSLTFAPSPPSPPPISAPALVLAGETGSQVEGAFLVENLRRERVSAPVVVAPFIGADERAIQPSLRVDPEVVTLESGEQTLVRVALTIPAELDEGVDYRGTVSVPGVATASVPIVLRRLGPAAP